MYDNYGKDDSTSPMAIIDADLPSKYLISKLQSIRSRMFYRVSDEALSEIEITNVIINTLRYKDDKERSNKAN